MCQSIPLHKHALDGMTPLTPGVYQRPQLNKHYNPTRWSSHVSLGRATPKALSGSYMNLWPRYPYQTDVCRVGTLRLTNEEKNQFRIINKLDYIYNLQSKIIKTLREFDHGFGNHQWYRNGESTNLFPKFKTLGSNTCTYNSFFFFFFFERVYLSQTDGICWGARCQMFLGHKILKV